MTEHDYRDSSEEPPYGPPQPPGWPHLPYQPRRSPADTVTGEFTRVMQDVLANLRDQLHRTHSPDELEAEIAGHCAEAAANQLRELLDGLIAYRDVNTVS